MEQLTRIGVRGRHNHHKGMTYFKKRERKRNFSRVGFQGAKLGGENDAHSTFLRKKRKSTNPLFVFGLEL